MLVASVKPGSQADQGGVRPGDNLVALGGQPVRDSLDVAYALGWVDDDDQAEYTFVRDGERRSLLLPPAHPDQLGMELAPDTYRTCGNRCLFCFVDQLPAGLRTGLYVKDEDFRLSFAFGNYITLTNLSDDDYERIAEQRLSPLYVSVHATDDAVRRRMLGNPAAPPITDALAKLASAGITLHTQIVVCPGVNDGAVLENTLADLAALGDCVSSIAVVPVGLTSHREGLAKLEPVTPEMAGELLDCVGRWQARFTRERGRSVVYAADELYLAAGRELPPCDAYDGFPQLENGVGLLRRFEADFLEAVKRLEGKVKTPLSVAVLTAPLAAPFLRSVLTPALAKAGGIDAHVIELENTLLGRSVTVAGLLAGADMVRAIADAPPDGLALLPGEAFNDDGVTIDGMTVEDIARQAGGRNVVATHDVVGAILDHIEATEKSA